MARPTDYFADVSKTDMMRVVVAMAGELYALSDRVAGLEAILRENGIATDALDAPAEPAALDPARTAERDAFVRRLFGPLAEAPSGGGAG